MRLNPATYRLEYFYAIHPDLKIFKEIWGISDNYLSEMFGEYKYAADASFLVGNGLYVYTWKYMNINDLDVYSDDNYYYIKLPSDMLPTFSSISFKRKGFSIRMSPSNDVSVVDYGDWFAIRMVKSFYNIDRNVLTSYKTISYNENVYEGFWIPEYSTDINYIENFFGNIFGVFINRDLYKSLAGSSSSPYYDPPARIMAIHSRYSNMMRDIVGAIMGYHSEEFYLLTDASRGTKYIYADHSIENANYSYMSIVNKTELHDMDYLDTVTAIVDGDIIDIQVMHGYANKIYYRLSDGSIKTQVVDKRYSLKVYRGDTVHAGDILTNGAKISLTSESHWESYNIDKIENKKIYISTPLASSFSKGSTVLLCDKYKSRNIKGHPSPSNIRFIIDSVMKNYAFNEDGVDIVDRVNTAISWVPGEVDNMFVAKIKAPVNIMSKKIFNVLFRILSYFKPIFTMAIVSSDDDNPKRDGIQTNDSLYMETIQLNMQSEYETFTVVAPTMRGKKKLNILASTSSVRDVINYKYVQKTNLGDINGSQNQ